MPQGGKRPGSGRKTNASKALAALKAQELAAKLPGIDAKRILADLQAEESIKALARSKSETMRYKVLSDLMDRAYGKPAATVTHEGQVEVKVVIDL